MPLILLFVAPPALPFDAPALVPPGKIRWGHETFA
jgi:hypothetical protein